MSMLRRRMMMQQAAGGNVRHELEMSMANELICTLLGRQFYKKYNGMAIVAVFKFYGIWFQPILVSTEADSVAIYSEAGNTGDCSTIEYGGQLWYVTDMTSAVNLVPTITERLFLNSVTGVVSYEGANNTQVMKTAAKDLLDYYYGVI